MCVHACVCVRMSVCACVCVSTRVCVHVRMSVCACVCVCERESVCECVLQLCLYLTVQMQCCKVPSLRLACIIFHYGILERSTYSKMSLVLDIKVRISSSTCILC